MSSYNLTQLEHIWNLSRKRKGWVYASVNPIQPHVLKVGLTQKDPFQRAKSLTTSGVLGTYNMLLAYMYTDCFNAETQAHEYLSFYNVEKELFNAPLDIVKKILIEIKEEEQKLYPELNLSYLLYDLSPDRWLSQVTY